MADDVICDAKETGSGNPQIYQKEFDVESDLHQGDVIYPSECMQEILKDVHGHFTDNKYVAFLILTQSCDLVRGRRGTSCKSNYINIAVVRNLKDVLPKLLDQVNCRRATVENREVEGIYIEEDKRKAKQLLQRIFNQNEQALGIFYLPENAQVRIAFPSVALLQVSIALRASDHYETLVESRVGRLNEIFRCRLGWLIGHLFSRVATEDWPGYIIREMTNKEMDRLSVEWISEANIAEVKKKKTRIEAADRQSIARILKQHSPRPPLNTAIDRVITHIQERIEGVSSDDLDAIRSLLNNDPKFKQSCK